MQEITKALSEVADSLDDQPTAGHLRDVAKRIADVSLENLRGDLLRRAMNVSIAAAELANYFDEPEK